MTCNCQKSIKETENVPQEEQEENMKFEAILGYQLQIQ